MTAGERRGGVDVARKLIMTLAVFTALAATLPDRCLSADEPRSLSHTMELPSAGREEPDWGRDLFRPLVSDVIGPDIRLEAVFYNRENPSAIVNGAIVYRGSTVEGQKVVDIGRTHVILRGELGTIKLEIAGVPELPETR